ncbi:MAG: AAA family ATPase [Actinomycetota bacterium]|nr:AAA family ATPase [Actinomycetota bacterium]
MSDDPSVIPPTAADSTAVPRPALSLASRFAEGGGGQAGNLATYVTRDAARLLAAHPHPSEASEELVAGAVLIADISGFTPLAESLARQGGVGAEELFRLLNGVFGRIVDIVGEHGGEIVTFAGDAVIAVWTAGSEGLGAATRAATACGLAACAAIGDYPVPGPRRLSLRVGIGAGDLRLSLVGGRGQRWLFLALGPALSQVRGALRRAGPGQVVLSAEACSLDHFVGAPLEAGLRRVRAVPHAGPWSPTPPRPFPIDERSFEALAPAAILARLGLAGSSWWAELRQVSVAFVTLIGDDSPSLEAIEAFAQAVQATAERYEATLKEMSADDKGVVAILVLGLAPLAHEDDGRRAVLAALHLQSRLARSGLDCSVGVASGRAFCGSVETSLRSDFAVIGDPMNLAARLMQAAGAGVLCDDETYHLTRGRIRYEPRSVIPAKGKADPVAVWSPLGPAPQSQQLPAMVGREPELARLVGRLDALETGTGALVVIEGEAGMGKSRLVTEVVRLARARGMNPAVAAADAIDRGSPYHPWRAAFAQLCGRELLADPGRLRAWVEERLLSERDRNLLPLLDSVLPLGIEDNVTTSQMKGSIRADNTNGLVLRLLEQAARAEASPLVVVLDDAQWLDSASWALTERVADSGRALVVVCKRPWGDPEPPAEASFLYGEGVEWVVLEGLAPDHLAALVAERVGAHEVSESVAEFVVERADGNPFFSEEIAYALRDAGLTVVTGGVFREARGAGDLRRQDLPHTLGAVIMSRLDRLPPPVQLTLKVASVAGASFSVRLLEAVHPVAAEREHVVAHLGTLARLGFVAAQSARAEPAYSFKHGVIRDVAYNLLLFAQRRQLHAAVAAWYEQEDPDEPVARYALLAHHWRHADVVEKAAENLGLAGTQALRAGSYAEAVGFLEDALVAGSEAHFVRRAEWERGLGEALLGQGRAADAREHLRRAVALAGWPEPRSKAGLVLRLLSQVAVQALARLGLRWLFFRTRATQEQNAEAAAGYVRLVETYWLSNDSLRMVYAAVAGLNVAERAGPSPDLARAYAIVCMASGSVPLHALARIYARRALETAHAVGQLEPLAYCSLITSVYAIGVGDWARAREGLHRAHEIFEELGDRRFAGYALGLLGMAANAEGDYDTSGRHFSALYVEGERHGSVQHQLWGLAGQAVGWLRKGRSDEALRLLQVAHTLVAEKPDPVDTLRIEALLAVVHLRRGDPGRCREWVAAAWRAAGVRRSVAAVALLQPYWALSDAALALWERGEDETAPVLARRARRELRRYARLFPIGRPRALVNGGLALWLGGRTRAARRSWRAGLKAAERLQMPYEAARAHYEIGRHLPEADPARRLHLEQASQLFAGLGAEDDVARARGALAAVPRG